ncbi:glycosyltransferase family 4 protein [Paenibacillus flagellatus]|uniref:Glycosyltransferase family 1 protein n=1 Tax=Paenibacillus flagellatus TaxID=2211139 RepID=A0A2V5KFX0_9BACL|nr:glycosyltransferase family 1 protein [Paenibacillus flagellatus]PYI53020.1 glycosyltransferase family 1 protein [Paenibacillus flagellatus]
MRVAIFTDTFLPDVNGVAGTLGRWVGYLESKKVQVQVYAPGHPEGAFDRYGTTMVHRFAGIPFVLYPECKLAIPNPFHIRKSLRQFRPTLVHVATPFNLGLYGHRYARKRGVPLVASYHTHFDRYLSHYKLQWLEPALWRYMIWFHRDCRTVYAPSPSTADHLRAKGIGPVELWPRGVDTGRFHPEADRGEVLRRYGVAEDRFVYLYVGRIAAEKSVDVLLDAFRALPEDVAERSRLVVVGDGPMLAKLRESHAGSGRIVFTGFVQGQPLAELYAAANAFLFPSDTETFGNVVLEAMAAGTAVVGAAAGGVGDIVAHEMNGLLCPPGDAKAFAAAATRLYRDRELLARLSEGGRRHARMQSWDAIFARLLRSFEAVAAGTEGKKVESVRTV